MGVWTGYVPAEADFMVPSTKGLACATMLASRALYAYTSALTWVSITM